MESRRKNPRSLCSDLVKIRWKDETGTILRDQARLENMSRGGVCLQMEHPIAPGTELVILYPRGMYRGKVKYCLLEGTDHLMGVEFNPGYRWFPRRFRPAHLLRIDE